MGQKDDNGSFEDLVNEKEKLKLKAKKEGKQSVWEGFGVFGVIGWSIALPTVLLGLLGLWLDEKYPESRSYTLSLLIAGLCLGCLNAWYWVDKKIKEFQEESENDRTND